MGPAVGLARSREIERPSEARRDVVVTIVLAVVVWIFSAGMLWQKVDDLDRDVQSMKSQLMNVRTKEAHATPTER